MVGSDVTSKRSPSGTQRFRRRQHFGAGTSEPIGADHRDDPDPARPVRVVVLGGGFAGLAAARRLAKAQLDVVVVDQRNFHTFQPLLYQVATAGLDASDVAYPIRTILRRCATIQFLHARAQAINVDQRIVRLSGGSGLSYDYLASPPAPRSAYRVSPSMPCRSTHSTTPVECATRCSWRWRHFH